MQRNVFFIFLLAALVSCSSRMDRKVMLFYNGEVKVTQNRIVNNTNKLFASREIDLSGFKYADQIEVDKDGKKFSIPFPKEAGYYVLNLSTDTVYGSLKSAAPVTIDSANTAQAKSLEDSLQLMLEGKNISEQNHNFRILPQQLQLINTKVANVRLFPPYKEMYGSVEGPEDGSDPLIYKFNTTEEVKFEMDNYRNIYQPLDLSRKPAKK